MKRGSRARIRGKSFKIKKKNSHLQIDLLTFLKKHHTLRVSSPKASGFGAGSGDFPL
jgi:hypothetical protein